MDFMDGRELDGQVPVTATRCLGLALVACLYATVRCLLSGDAKVALYASDLVGQMPETAASIFFVRWIAPILSRFFIWKNSASMCLRPSQSSKEHALEPTPTIYLDNPLHACCLPAYAPKKPTSNKKKNSNKTPSNSSAPPTWTAPPPDLSPCDPIR
ncbi:unnamed protein product [Acanthoscelides obtectus]|uniref:Uncharacterized protein n=1 Tax=Acanthoscelides obtectus TaxID=200917 RepID=A0A9P0JVN6_ACAOB|nr:unnamed protein product [Acanthoscelides obtectus]CAK1666072.1 hypothetical protein AOBTE_LOCUS25145 [Acanthoscelides obtectus]